MFLANVVALATLLLPGLPPEESARSQARTVHGRVLDAATGEPVVAASVRLVGTPHVTMTGDEGSFHLADVAPGRYQMEVEHISYAALSDSVTVPGEQETLELEVLLSADAIDLRPLNVEVRSAKLEAVGFYRRKASGVGTFITGREIREEGARLLSDYIASVSGVRRSLLRGGTYSLNMRGRKTIVTDCSTQYFLDGVPANMAVAGIDEVLPEAVEGIEIYRGSSELPPQYMTGRAMCGAILIWTRTGKH